MEQFDDQQSMRGLGDYWAVVVRRRWWIIGPLFIGWLLVFLSAWVIPAKYTSETVILVEQQKVPEHYVLPNVQVDLGERLQAITQQVLSRTRLLGIINDLHLYQSFLTPTPDDQITAMRKDIKIDLIETPNPRGGPGELTAFKVSYTADKPAIAQQVNTRLASFFIDENVRASQQQSESTTQFLDSQLKAAAASLAEQQAKLGEFQKKHVGELPSELQSNLQVLTATETELQGVIDARNRAVQQQAYLTSMAAQYDALGPESASGNGGPQSLDQQIENARAALADLQAKYTNDHPDIKKMKDTIAKLEQLKQEQDSEAKAAVAGTTDNDSGGDKDKSANTDSGATAAAPMSKSMLSLMQLQSQIKANKIEIQTRDAEIKRLEEKAAVYQARLNAEPQTESDMGELTRGLDQSKKSYDDLLSKRNMSGIATNLERQQQGEQFRVIDPPSLPEKASFPDRFKFSLAGLGVGLVLALVLGGGLEFVDDRIRSEQDLAEASPLPVLVEVPPLPTEKEIAAAKWKPWIALAAAILVAIIIPSGILYAFYWG